MLYICATPIGNLGDITLRALEVLKDATLVLCEDTRHSGRLLAHYGIKADLLSLHEHNEDERLAAVLPRLREGAKVVLISDAGMPLLSDPGFRLVRACVGEGIQVTVLPGASSVDTALVASGLPPDRFLFLGFLPRGSRKLTAFLQQADSCDATLVAFESPRRVRSTLARIAEGWPGRQVALCRELTKMHEEVLRGTAAEILDRLATDVKGEVVLVLGPANGEAAEVRPRESTGTERRLEPASRSGFASARSRAIPEVEVEIASALLAAGHSTKDAARLLAAATGRSAKTAYSIVLRARAGAAKLLQ